MCIVLKDLEEICPTMCSTMHSFLMELYPLNLLKREKFETRLPIAILQY